MALLDLVSISPHIALAAAIVIALLLCAFARRHSLVAAVAMAGTASAMALLVLSANAPRRVTALLVMDSYAIAFSVLVLGGTLVTAALSADYLSKGLRRRREEFYVLLLLAALGGLVLSTSDHFASFFLGLETLSVALYGMIAYVRNQKGALEAGIKYLVLAGAGSAFLLFGMALIYLETGTMSLADLGSALRAGNAVTLGAAAVLMMVGVGFKLALAPFHMWTPDVYDGAPAPVTGFLATVSKAAVFAVVIRMFMTLPPDLWENLAPVFVVIALVSMTAGNLLALLERRVKRILAYSSIAHMGYVLVAFLAGGRLGAAAASFYLYAYTVTTLAAFGAIGALVRDDGEPEVLEDYSGLFRRRPALSGVLALSLFSLAGIPLTAGFLGKFYLVAAGADRGLWLLLAFLVANSAIGLFYYLRIVSEMFSRAAETAHETRSKEEKIGGRISAVPATLALSALVILLLWIGTYPAPLVDWMQRAVTAILP